jgi:hypothetical protein
MMDFGHRGIDKLGSSGFLGEGVPPIREVVEAACEELGPSKRLAVSASVKQDLGMETCGEKEVDNAVWPSDLGLQQRSPARSTNLSKCAVQKRPTAIEKSARIAIKAKRRIILINAADLVAVEARGNYVLLLHSSGSHTLRESISTVELRD